MTVPAWVLGAGGLLGSHVSRAVEEHPALSLHVPRGGRIPWEDPPAARHALREHAAGFFAEIAAAPGADWAVLWCAGAGVVGTSPAALDAERATFDAFLEALDAAMRSTGCVGRRGLVFLSSSAGGVHGGSPERPITEHTPPAPISPYGRAKLELETRLAAWAAGRGVSTLIARISNLYGPGQNMAKPQGLVSHMSRTLIHRQAIHVYVPLDTIRDYLFAGDAGRWIAAWTARVAAEHAAAGAPAHVLKICAAQEETTIASLIGAFRRIAKRHLKVVNGIHPALGQQPLKLQFRSVIWPEDPEGVPRTGLLDGIARVYRHQLALYEAGELPPPSRSRI